MVSTRSEDHVRRISLDVHESCAMQSPIFPTHHGRLRANGRILIPNGVREKSRDGNDERLVLPVEQRHLQKLGGEVAVEKRFGPAGVRHIHDEFTFRRNIELSLDAEISVGEAILDQVYRLRYVCCGVFGNLRKPIHMDRRVEYALTPDCVVRAHSIVVHIG